MISVRTVATFTLAAISFSIAAKVLALVLSFYEPRGNPCQFLGKPSRFTNGFEQRLGRRKIVKISLIRRRRSLARVPSNELAGLAQRKTGKVSVLCCFWAQSGIPKRSFGH